MLRQLPLGCLLFSEAPLTVGDSEPEPDLFIAKGTHETFRRAHPTTAALVIEVAVSSLELDRLKALIYAEAGVPEYWIVRPEDHCVEIYRQPDGQNYREQTTLTAPAILESSALPGVSVNLAELLG